jgi:GGDEF domain-containing protein
MHDAASGAAAPSGAAGKHRGVSDGPDLVRAPRAVADVPPPALADGEAVAKAWLLALLAAAPLASAPAVPVAELAAGGPPLCAALLAAVGSEAALDRLRPGGDRAALAAGAAALAGARDPAVAAGAVAALRRALSGTLARELRDVDAATTAALAERIAHIADVVTAAVLAPAIGADLAGAEEPWRVGIDRRLAAGGAPFAVFAVEADDAERLAAAGGADAAALDALEPAVRDAARPGAEVVRERPGRLWVLAPAEGANALAGRIAEAAGAAAAPHGTPLGVAVGIARWPDDGPDAAALAARADERLFAARAAGVPVL